MKICNSQHLGDRVRRRGGERTTEAKIAAVAKSELPKPSRSPTATVSAVTVAECDDGIPPDPTSCFGSHRFSLYLRAADPVTESSDLPTTDGPARPATSVPCGEDLDRLGDGEHRGDERAVGEHGEVGERGRAGGRRRRLRGGVCHGWPRPTLEGSFGSESPRAWLRPPPTRLCLRPGSHPPLRFVSFVVQEQVLVVVDERDVGHRSVGGKQSWRAG
jgi:hypothetical protein